jgi:hypothetical protein
MQSRALLDDLLRDDVDRKGYRIDVRVPWLVTLVLARDLAVVLVGAVGGGRLAVHRTARLDPRPVADRPPGVTMSRACGYW